MLKAYVLNLPHRTDRWEHMLKEFDGKCELIKADCVMIDDNNLSKIDKAYHGVAYTHIQLIKDAKERGDKTILILEDDCIMADKTSWSKWLLVKEWLDNNMDRWEMFNGGVVMPEHIETFVMVDDIHLIKHSGGGGAHFLYINVDKSYQYILDWVIDKEPIDTYYSTTFNYWVSLPLLVLQKEDFSDIQGQNRNWDCMIFATRKKLEHNIQQYLHREGLSRNRR